MAEKALHCSAASSWYELQPELLELVLKKLDFVNIVRVKAVCSSWNHAAKSPYRTPLLQAPWLMLPSDRKHYRCFFSLAEKKIYTIKNVFHGFQGTQCVGSSHGWLVIWDYKQATPHLFNPISGVTIQLPCLHFEHLASRYTMISKVVLSSDPSRNNNFVVVFIFDALQQRPAFYKHGEHQNIWTELISGAHQKHYRDIIFQRDQYRLVALANDDSIQVWDFKETCPMKTMDFEPSMMEVVRDDFPSSTIKCSETYLVESLGEVFFVEWVKVDLQPNNIEDMLHFYISKLNFTAEKYENIECLSDRALCLDENKSAILLSTWNFPEFEGNSVYFPIEFNETYYWYVYNLETKVKSYYKYGMVGCRDYSLPFWIVPNPW